MRVCIDPVTEDDLYAKYLADDRWKITRGEQGKIYLECKTPPHEVEDYTPEFFYN